MGKPYGSGWAFPIAGLVMLGGGAFLACGSSNGDGNGSSSGDDGSSGNGGRDGGVVLEDGAVVATPACQSENGAAPVQAGAVVLDSSPEP